MDFKGRLALPITGFKVNCIAKEMRVQISSESQQNKSKNNACAYSFKKVSNDLISMAVLTTGNGEGTKTALDHIP